MQTFLRHWVNILKLEKTICASLYIQSTSHACATSILEGQKAWADRGECRRGGPLPPRGLG